MGQAMNFAPRGTIVLALLLLRTSLGLAQGLPSGSIGGSVTSVADGQPFDPFKTKPVEGIHYALSPTFGQAMSPRAYQQPRTFVVSMGARF